MHAFQSTQLFQLRRRCALGPVASGSRARSETIWPHLSVLRAADAGQLYLCVLPESALPESAVWQRCAAAVTRARSLMLCIARRMASTERETRSRRTGAADPVGRDSSVCVGSARRSPRHCCRTWLQCSRSQHTILCARCAESADRTKSDRVR